MTRVLAFSPYPYKLHMLYELTITRACQVRGAEVKHVLCDGLFSECDVHLPFYRATPRPLDLCDGCQANANTIMKDAGIPFEWLGKYLDEQARREVFEWAQTLAPVDFPTARFRFYPVAEWVASSVCSAFRRYPPSLEDWYAVNVYRGFLYSGALASIAIDHLLDSWSPDALIVVNGRQSLTRIAFELAQRRGIRVLTHERPSRSGTLFVLANATCNSFQPFKAFWRDWQSIPLTRTELGQAREWQVERRYGINQTWYSFATPPVNQHDIRKKLRLNLDRLLLVAFTTSTDEIGSDPEWQGVYSSQTRWIEQLLIWMSGHSQYDLVIRVHPNSGSKFRLAAGYADQMYFERIRHNLPPNVRIVMPMDPLSSYALMDDADVGLTFSSTAGVETAMLGKPVVLASRAAYEDVPHLHVVRSTSEFSQVLEQAIRQGPSREIRRYMFRFVYRYFLQIPIAFPLVSILGPHDAKSNYDSPEELGIGKDPGLDRICDFVLSGKPLYSPLTENVQSSVKDEEEFLSELEQSPNPFRDSAFESRLLISYKLAKLGQSVQASTKLLPTFMRAPLIKAGRAVYGPLVRRLLGA